MAAEDNNPDSIANEKNEADVSRPPADDTPAVGPAADSSDIEQNKGLAVISYIGPLFIIPLLTAKDSEFAMFHANQGLLLFIAEVVFWVVVIVLALVPFLGPLIMLAGWLFLLVLFILGIVNAAGGVTRELPVIGRWRILK